MKIREFRQNEGGLGGTSILTRVIESSEPTEKSVAVDDDVDLHDWRNATEEELVGYVTALGSG